MISNSNTGIKARYGFRVVIASGLATGNAARILHQEEDVKGDSGQLTSSVLREVVPLSAEFYGSDDGASFCLNSLPFPSAAHEHHQTEKRD